MSSHPNIFDWATSELSQDAFLCWLVAHAGANERPDLQHVARAFIAWLWNSVHPERPCEAASVTLVAAPQKQQAHTDICFAARIHGAVVPFLMEDKVDTSHHSEQLARYAKWLSEQRLRHGASDDVKVYYKTGYHFEEDRAAAQHGYVVLGLEDIVKFFDEHPAASDFLADYRSHISTMLERRRDALAGFRQLKHDFVQYEFLRELKARCPEHIDAGGIRRAKSIGGAPWTHYAIARFPKVLMGIDETLFLRVDARQDNGNHAYYLCLRQFGKVKQPDAHPDARSVKLARLKEHRQHFEAACEAVRGKLRFGQVSNDYHGANESEIGLVFFDETQTPSVVLSVWPALHRALIERLQAMVRPSP